MKVVIDNTDFSRLFHRYGLTIQPKKRYGSNGDVALSGEKLVDLLATKDVLTLACNPMSTQQRDALAAACAKATVILTYNPGGDGDADRTIRAEPNVSAARVKLRYNGVTHWDGITVTMEEI